MRKKTVLNRILALTLSAAMIFSAGGMSAEAAQEGVSGQDIVAGAGNQEMKAYGMSLEDGGKAFVNESVVPESSGTAYYVDSISGNDKNDGRSESTAWKSIGKVNEKTFQPGDKILLKAGAVWERETLSPKGSGTARNPIILSAYGDGELPKLIGHAEVGELIYLENQEGWDISNLEISNKADGFDGKSGELLKDVRGIRIAADPGQEQAVLTGYNLHDLYVHDVTGKVFWIGGSGVVSPGVEKGGGWDGSKRNGGILFEVLAPEEGEQPVIFSDITIEKNVINNNSFGGIIIKQWKGDKRGTNEYWANREKGNNWTPHQNVVVQDNYLSQKASDFACNTIYLTSIDGATVQRNVSREAGTCGIELYYTDHTVVQYNEVYDTRVKAGGADSNAIDPDKLATNALIQYNYIHDTGDGILLCGFVEGTSVVRYNVIQDAEKRYLNPHGDKGENYIYNNIFYNSKGGADFVLSSGGAEKYHNDSNNFYYLYNNIFYNAAEEDQPIAIIDGTSVQFDNNCYYGKNVAAPSNEKNAFLADPQFVDSDISGAKTDINVLQNLKLQETSPLLGMGRAVDLGSMDVEVGETDFFGAAVNSPASVGIAEYTGEKAIVKGYVTDEYDNKVADAVITLSNGMAVTTDGNGYYQFVGIDAGSFEGTISKIPDYEDEKITIQAADGKVTVQNLRMGTCKATTGNIQGTVTYGGRPLADVKVNVTGNGVDETMQTDESGTYSFNLAAGEGYVITVSKDGYDSKTIEGIKVKILATSVNNIQLAKTVTAPEYSVNEDFSSFETGTFVGNDFWGITDPKEKGSITIEEEEDGNKYLHLDKNNKSAALAFYNKTAIGMEGTVTLEMRVKRTKAGGTADQYGLYSFNGSDWNVGNPSGSKNPMATAALAKGKILTHNVRGNSATKAVQDYQMGQWYTIRNVVDLSNGTFDFYVDDMETPKLANQPLRTQKSPLDYINIFSSSNNEGDFCVDYIRVCKGVSYDYTNADLKSLTAEGVEITFTDGEYRAEVSAETEQIALVPEPDSPFAAVSINGTVWDKENPVSIALTEGDNTIPIIVTAEGGQKKEYRFVVTKKQQPSPDTLGYLTSLSLENILLDPAFDKYTEEYSAETELGMVKMSFVKAAESCKTEVRVNDSLVDNIEEIALESGMNTISVYVESGDGADQITYTIHINCTKEPEVQGPDKTELNNLITSAKQIAATEGIYTTESIEALESAISAAEEISQKADAVQEEIDELKRLLQEAIDALVKAEEPSPAAYLSELGIEGVVLTPEFNKTITEYTAETDAEQIALNFRMESDQSSAEVKVNETMQEDWSSIELQEGENIITVAVTSEDGNNHMIYSVKVMYLVQPVIPEVNKTELNNLIAEAEQLAVTEGYTAGSIENLQNAIAAAKETLAKEAVTQTEIDGQRSALQAAIDALEKEKILLVDENTQISVGGKVGEGTTLRVISLESGEVYQIFADYILKNDNSSKFRLFDITLLRGEAEVQPEGAITVSIPVPEGFGDELKLYRQENDGTMTELPYELKEGCLVFTTDHLSHYAVADIVSQTPGGDNQTPDGDDQTPGGDNQTPDGDEQTPGGDNQTSGGDGQAQPGGNQNSGGNQKTGQNQTGKGNLASSQSVQKAAKTGDTANISIFIIIMLASLGTGTSVIYFRRKRRY